MSKAANQTYFLLTTDCRDTHGHFEIYLWGVSSDDSNPVKVIIDKFQPLFFVPRSTPFRFTENAAHRKQLPLKAMDGTVVDCLYFATNAACINCAKRLRELAIPTYESDVHPFDRFLMERMVKGGFSVTGEPEETRGFKLFRNPRIRGADVHVSLSILSIDIETDAYTDELYSIACCGRNNHVFIIGKCPNNRESNIICCQNEHELLSCFLSHLKREDPDLLIGWNVVNFDLMVLKKRCEALSISFEIGREPGTVIKPKREDSKHYFVKIPGRVVIDVPTILRSGHYSFERYTLNHVASEMLGKQKKIELEGRQKIEEIRRLFREDKQRLVEYNLHDALLTREIFDKSNMLANAVERSKRSGRLLDQYGGSVAAFDYLYLPLLHKEGYIAGNVADISISNAALTGGYVIEPIPGIYENVLMFDFKSLYPTIIMTFFIDPLGAISTASESVKGPTGIEFSRKKTILPNIIAELMEARTQAKKTGNQSLSYAIKILMNSFYGVLGSTGCRFFSHKLAQTITETGQYILKSTRTFIEQNTPYSVIYGDTDSLFVLLGPGLDKQAEKIGSVIAEDVNNWLKYLLKDRYNVDSVLELEFEMHFRHFFMPAIRGGSQGSKKRYCGAFEKKGALKLLFKGLESARSDWTCIAKEFQQNLYGKVFRKLPVKEYILETVDKIKKGLIDEKLIYQKQLRKPINEYRANIPPHVQAAKLLDNPENVIRYYITKEGPQPIEKLTAALDYEHYLDTQIKPIADSILEWINLDFDTIVSGQQDLFEGI